MTSMSELSTVAIKDGHRGHVPHNHHSLLPQQDAERADRISRLAGLERVATARNPTPISSLTPGTAAPPVGGAGYFDPQNMHTLGRERSTVGSASATGSVGGRTTWASGSDVCDPDKMSESQDMDMDTSSVGGTSDTNSLVGFGEGARTPARISGYGSPGIGKATPTAATSAPLQRDACSTPVSAHAFAEQRAARNVNGMNYDGGVVDSADPPFDQHIGSLRGSSSAEATERILRERLGPDDAR